MSSISEWFNQTVASVTGRSPQQHVDNVKKSLSLPPSLTTDEGSATILGAPQEGAGRTCTGGRRARKPRNKKSKKTRRGGKYY